MSVSRSDSDQSEADARRAHYEAHLAPAAAELESKRQQAYRGYRSRQPVFWLVLILAILFAIFLFHPFTVFLAFVACLAAWGYARHPLSQFSNVIKADLCAKAVAFLGPGFTHSAAPPWGSDRVRPFGIVPGHNRRKLFDHIRGQYRDVPLEMTQALLQKHSTDSKGRSRTRTVFRGLLVIMTPPKVPKGDIQIHRDYGWVGNALGSVFNFSDLEKVRLEDPEFEKRFEVHAKDQIEARTILTPSFMTRLLELEEGMDRGRVTAAFHNRELLIMIPSHTLFQPTDPKSPLDLEGDFYRFIDEMQVLFRVIDTLKLDQDIGL